MGARTPDWVVYLCWKLGESEIMYYHARHSGYAGRKPLSAALAAAVSEDEFERSCV